MSFLFPWAAWFAALVPVVVGLYMLRQRRRRVVVPSILRWRASPVPAPSRIALGRVRGWRSLLLNLLIFLLILAALARPEFASFWNPEPTVVVLDARLRMSALGPDGTTVFERAQSVGADIAAQAGDRSPVAVLSTTGEIAPFSTDARQAVSLVERMLPADSGGGVDGTIDLAKEMRGEPPGRIVFVTDRPSAMEGIDVIAVGVPMNNAAVSDFSTRALSDGGQSRAMFVRVRNFSTTAITRDLELRIDDRLLDVIPVRLEAGETFETVRTFTNAEARFHRGAADGDARR